MIEHETISGFCHSVKVVLVVHQKQNSTFGTSKIWGDEFMVTAEVEGAKKSFRISTPWTGRAKSREELEKISFEFLDSLRDQIINNLHEYASPV